MYIDVCVCVALHCQTEIPLNDDRTEWLYKKPAAASVEMTRLMTPLSGRVFEIQEKLKQQKEAKKQTKDPLKILTGDASKDHKQGKRAPKAKSKGKAKAQSKKSTIDAVDGDTDIGKMDAEIVVQSHGGTTLTREKYFVDCLVMCARSAVRAARQRFSVMIPDEVVAAERDTGHLVYTDVEFQLLRDVVRRGILFANTGESMLQKKVHKKWTTMRPALQSHLMQCYEKAARCTEQLLHTHGIVIA